MEAVAVGVIDPSILPHVQGASQRGSLIDLPLDRNHSTGEVLLFSHLMSSNDVSQSPPQATSRSPAETLPGLPSSRIFAGGNPSSMCGQARWTIAANQRRARCGSCLVDCLGFDLLNRKTLNTKKSIGDSYMDPKTVEKLEGKIEESIAEIIVKMGVGGSAPAIPPHHAPDAESCHRRVRGSSGEQRPWAIPQGPACYFPSSGALLGTFRQQEVGGGTAKIVLSLHHDEFGASSSSSFEVPSAKLLRDVNLTDSGGRPIADRAGGRSHPRHAPGSYS